MTELADKIEAAERPSRELEEEIYRAIHGSDCPFYEPPAYTASLDAAMRLVPEHYAVDCLKEGEPGRWYVNIRPRDWLSEWKYGNGATPALALVAAALRAGDTDAK